jgi:hypothetical protein
MGEAINLVNNFKVERVIFNCGPYNDLEQYLIKVLEKNKIAYYSCIKELNMNDNKLYFLNNKDYRNENISLENEANETHYEVGKEIRNTIKKLGGTMPENLPTPNKSLKELEKGRKIESKQHHD